MSPQEAVQFLAGAGIPDADDMVVTCGDDFLAIQAVGHRHDSVGVALKLTQFLAGVGIPDASSGIIIGGDDSLAVGAVDRRMDSRCGLGVGVTRGRYRYPRCGR